MRVRVGYCEALELQEAGYSYLGLADFELAIDFVHIDVHPKVAEAIAGYREDWPPERSGDCYRGRMSIAEYVRRCRAPKVSRR